MANNLELEINTLDKIGIVAVKGYINNIGGEQLAAACNELIDTGIHLFVINLEACRIVNSMGISFLIEIVEKVLELEGRIAFCHVSPTIGKTLRIMGLLQASTLHETQEEALEMLSASPN